MGAATVDPADSQTTLSGERVSYGERWSSSESESSTRSYRDVACTPPPTAALPAAAVPGSVAPAARRAVKDRLGPRSEVHRVSGGPVLDADGFQQPRRRHRRRRPRPDNLPSPSFPPRRRSPSPKEVAGLCFRCLDHRHRVRDCPNDIRCRRCLASGHASCACGGRRSVDASPQPPRVDVAVQPRPPRGAAARASSPAARRRVAPPPPPPAPARQPPLDGHARVIMAQTVEMDEAELVLARAMVASITGNRPRVSTDEVAELLLSSLELAERDLTVHVHHPEDFLIIFFSLATMRLLGKQLIYIEGPRGIYILHMT
ncbi:hypothetical protein D1007_57480 [Hordeum vulgare]|nr:hypothetical protein D1007_57480 [Hordeum vulgare]